MCHSYYKLDPTHYLTLPSFSFDECLKFTQVKFQLISDIEMHALFESNLRGGIATVTNRYARANNKYLNPKYYKGNEPNCFISLLDANNLYAKAVNFPLPTGQFKFLSDREIAELDFTNIPVDHEYVFVI
jgi:hypothetical protein